MEARPLATIVHDRLGEIARQCLEDNPAPGNDATPDAVHDTRVALRRIRSHLRTFARLLERGVAMGIRADLRWYAAYLGTVRDLDVATLRLAASASSTDEAESWSPIEALLKDERAAALDRLREAQGVARYDKVLEHLGALEDVPLRTQKHDGLGPFLERPWRDYRSAVRALDRRRAEIRLHEVRIRSKALRYAGEIAAEQIGDRGAALAKSASALQDRIGEHRDALFAADLLCNRTDALGEGAFLAGMLVLIQREESTRALAKLDDDLRSLARSYKRLRRSLD